MNPGYVGRVMAGKRMPSLEYAARIARFKGITIDALYDIIKSRRPKVRDEKDPKSGINSRKDVEKVVNRTGGPKPSSVKPKTEYGFEVYRPDEVTIGGE